jgi:hypothetical protein
MDESSYGKHGLLREWCKDIQLTNTQIEEDLVRNQFIINQSIEQTVLIEDMKEGAHFMDARGKSTEHVKMCFTFADGDTRKGRVISYTNNGGINNSPIAEYSGPLRMQVDEPTQIKCEQTIHMSGNLLTRYVGQRREISLRLKNNLRLVRRSLVNGLIRSIHASLGYEITNARRKTFKLLSNVPTKKWTDLRTNWTKQLLTQQLSRCARQTLQRPKKNW